MAAGAAKAPANPLERQLLPAGRQWAVMGSARVMELSLPFMRKEILRLRAH